MTNVLLLGVIGGTLFASGSGKLLGTTSAPRELNEADRRWSGRTFDRMTIFEQRRSVVVVVAILELVVGLGATVLSSDAAVGVVLALLVGYFIALTGFAVLGVASGRSGTDCNCFGTAVQSTVGRFMVARNASLVIAVAIAGIALMQSGPGSPTSRLLVALSTMLLVYLLGLARTVRNLSQSITRTAG